MTDMAVKSEEELQKALKNIHAGHRQRMRDKFTQTCTLDHFQDHEILEMLLFRALPRRNTNPIAHHLLLKFGSLDKVLDAEEADLQTVPGIGPKAAAMLHSIPDLARRLDRLSYVPPEQICLRRQRDLRAFLQERFPNRRAPLYLLELDQDYHFLAAIPFYSLGQKYIFQSLGKFNLTRGERLYCVETVEFTQEDPPLTRSKVFSFLAPVLNAYEYDSWDYFFSDGEDRLCHVASGDAMTPAGISKVASPGLSRRKRPGFPH